MIPGFLITASLVWLVGCGAEQAEVAEEAYEEAAEVAAEAMPAAEMPEASADALWAYLQGADYQANWPLWPGKSEKYEGTEPHGVLLTTYVNDLGRDAITNTAGTMPANAIIVKENYMPDGTLAAITTMYKVEGYNPEAGDWHWVKFLPDGSVDNDGMAQGKVAGCIGCHGAKADNDYVFTGSLSGTQ
jgi:hypothetical protein